MTKSMYKSLIVLITIVTMFFQTIVVSAEHAIYEVDSPCSGNGAYYVGESNYYFTDSPLHTARFIIYENLGVYLFLCTKETTKHQDYLIWDIASTYQLYWINDYGMIKDVYDWDRVKHWEYAG